MAKVFDDLASRFISFSEALEVQFGDLSIDFTLPSKTLKSSSKATADASSSARAQRLADEERQTALQRGEAILQQLPLGYFDKAFDALEHELRQMGLETRQEDIDAVVDRLTAAMEVVSLHLARHVLKNQDKLIAGITSVTDVEDDVKAAFIVCQGSRMQLHAAADEVQRQIQIITSTRKKQRSMEVLDVLRRLQKINHLPATLRQAHEEGNHAEAILLCVNCFHAVDTLRDCKVAPALQVAVQRAYFDAMQQLHTALLNVCANFDGSNYSKLLETFLLQGVPPHAVAEKVLACFSELLKDITMRLVRSMLLTTEFAKQTQPAYSSLRSSGGPNSALHLDECSFADLCRQVPADMLQPCLQKLLEAVYDLFVSYHSMQAWHQAGLAEHTQAAAAAAAATAAAVTRSPAHSQGGTSPAAAEAQGVDFDTHPSQEQLDQVQAATKGILAGVQAALQDQRMATTEAAATLVKELLVGAGGCTGSSLPQVVSNTLKFAAMAEAFAGDRLHTRDAFVHVLGAFVTGSHKSNIRSLKHALAVETWTVPGQLHGVQVQASAAGKESAAISATSIHQSLCSCCLKSPAKGEDGFLDDFNEWVTAGNPFRKLSRSVGGRSVLSASNTTTEIAVSSAPAVVQVPTAEIITSSKAASHQAVSASCRQVLQGLADYAALMTVLPAQQQQLWGGMAEMFDNYLLACFVLFSGISLQTLVWQDDCLPNRLRNALLRITTSNSCKYKAEVEELLQTKPLPSNMDSSSTGSSGVGSIKLDVLTKKFKDTMVDLINADLSKPLNDPHGHNPVQPSGRQQPPQQPSRSNTPKTPEQPQREDVSRQPCQPLSQHSSCTAEAGPGSANTPTSSSPDCSSSAHHEGIQEAFLRRCVLAIDSLTLLADTLKAAKPALLQVLRGVGISKDVEGFFSRTVDAAADLKDAIYLGAARKLLPGMADADYGLACAIAECNYNMAEPATRYQPWVAGVLQHYTALNSFVAGSTLPAEVQQKIWEAALRLGADAMLDGVGQVRRCSQQGRAAMSLDLSAVEKGLRPLAPTTALSNLRRVDAYIKAFYIPWEELGRWAQTHLAEYGKARTLVLVECIADAYGIKRGQRAAMIDYIRTQLNEFA